MSQIQWYSPMDNLNEITPDNLLGSFDISLNNITNIQGSACINISIPSGSGEGHIYNSTTVSFSNTTLGFYFKPISYPSYIMEWINNSATSYIGFVNNGTYINAEYASVGTGTLDYTICLTSVLNIGSWNWLEIKLNSISPLNATFYINGVNLKTITDVGNNWSGLLTPSLITGSFLFTSSLYSLDYVRFYTSEEYPPYLPSTSTSGNSGIDLSQLPVSISSWSGLPVFASGIIATLVLFLFAEMLILIFASDNLVLIVIVGVLVISIGVSLTWLPFYTIIGVIFVIALLFADVFRKLITGQH